MFFKHMKALLLSVFLFGVIIESYANVVVIVHPSNMAKINKATVEKIFLGKTKVFPNGAKAVPVELIKGSKTRKIFNEHFLRKKESNLNAYWTRMIFAGKATPPKAYDSGVDIKDLVANNPSIIGYIDSSLVDSSVKIVSFGE